MNNAPSQSRCRTLFHSSGTFGSSKMAYWVSVPRRRPLTLSIHLRRMQWMIGDTPRCQKATWNKKRVDYNNAIYCMDSIWYSTDVHLFFKCVTDLQRDNCPGLLKLKIAIFQATFEILPSTSTWLWLCPFLSLVKLLNNILFIRLMTERMKKRSLTYLVDVLTCCLWMEWTTLPSIGSWQNSWRHWRSETMNQESLHYLCRILILNHPGSSFWCKLVFLISLFIRTMGVTNHVFSRKVSWLQRSNWVEKTDL